MKPRLKFILLENGGGVTATEYPESSEGDVVGPTIYGHAGAAGAISVGAVAVQQQRRREPYSSRGPVTHYFGPVDGDRAGGAARRPQTIAKPDLGRHRLRPDDLLRPDQTPRASAASAAPRPRRRTRPRSPP